MKRKILICAMLALCLVIGVSAAGCGEKQPPSPPSEVSVALDEESVTLDLFEKCVLTVTVENSTDAVVWNSSDSDVVRVVGGNLTAIGTGKATVTASVGGKSAECAVTVVDSGTAYVLDTEESVVIGKNDELTVSAQVWRGNKYKVDDEFVTYLWQLAQNADDDVAEPAEANKASTKFRGLNVGTTQYVLSAVIKGTTISSNLAITVRNTQVRFDFTEVNGANDASYFKPDAASGVWKARIAMKTVGETHKNTVATGFTVTDGETPKAFSDVTFSYKDGDADAYSDSSQIVSFVNGTLTALKEGSTVVKGVYDGVEMEFAVETYRPRVEIDNAEPIELEREASDMASGKAITFSFTETVKLTDETVESLKLTKNAFTTDDLLKANGTTTLNGDNLTVTVVKDNLPYAAKHLGETELVLATDKADYVFDAFVYTKKITNATELQTFGALAHVAAEKAENPNAVITPGTANGIECTHTTHDKNSGCPARGLWDGYFVLGNDIPFDGVYKPFITSGIIETGEWTSQESVPSGTVFFEFVGSGGGGNWNEWREAKYGFRGVFDGRGYNIAGMKIEAGEAGFISLLNKDGVIKNVSFTDAEIGRMTSFLVATGAGTIENVYVQATSQKEGAKNNNNPTRYSGFLYGSADTTDIAKNVPTIKNVLFVSPVAAETDKATAIGGGAFGKNMFENVVSVSAATPFGTDVINGTPDNVGYHVYDSFTALKNSGLTFVDWDTDFWTLQNGLPYPKKFAANPGVQDNNLLECHPNDEATAKDTLTYKLKNAASIVSVNGGTANFTSAVDFTVTPAQTDAAKQNVTVTVTNAYDPTKTQTHTVSVAMKLETVKVVADSTQRNNSDTIDVDLSDVAATGFYLNLEGKIFGENVTVKSLTLGGIVVDLQNVQYSDGKLTVKKAAYTDTNAMYGEKKLSATLETSAAVYVIDADVVFADIIIKSSNLDSFKKTELPNKLRAASGILYNNRQIDDAKTGYIILATDIACDSTADLYGTKQEWADGTNAPSGQKGCFAGGVFDGRNHVIKGFTTDKNGLFPTVYNSVIKNVTFIDATWQLNNDNLRGGIISSNFEASTLENVAVYGIMPDGSTETGEWSNPPSMLISQISNDMQSIIKNCLVVIQSCGTNYPKGGMAIGEVRTNGVKIDNLICINMQAGASNDNCPIYRKKNNATPVETNVHAFYGWEADRTAVNTEAFGDGNITFFGNDKLPVSESVMTETYKTDIEKYYPQGTDFTTENDA